MAKNNPEKTSSSCCNITDKALPGTNQLLEAVLKNTSMMAVYLDTNFNFIWVNPAYAATCKHEPDFFPGKNHFDLYPHAENLEIFQRVVSSGEPYFTAAKPFEFPDQPERGVTYWDWSLIPAKAPDGKVTGLVFTLSDVTKRIRAENELAYSKQQIETILGITKTGVDIIDPDYNLLYVDPNWQKTYGEPNGRKCYEYFMGTEKPCQGCGIPVALETKEVQITEETLPRENKRIVEVHSIPLCDSSGKRVVAEFNVDITDRKHAEEALLRAKKEWERTFDAVPDLIALLDTNHRIIRVNRAMAERLGTTPEKVIGLPCHETIHGLSAPPDYCPHSKTMASGKGQRIEVTEKRLGGIFDVTTMPFHDDTGKLVGSVHIAHDITARKKSELEREKLESQLTQSQKMESIGRLAGGVAHDYNNMLSVINGYSEILLQNIAPSDPLHECVQEIRKAGLRSSDLTRQLLGFARKQTIVPKVLNLNDNIENILKMLRRLLGEDIELDWQPSHAILHVKMDPSQLDQILTNLLVNARDAISGVGKAVIKTDMAELDETYSNIFPDFIPGRYVALSVRDNGSGMDKETLAHLFEPFFTTKGTGKGSGLGLATVFGIVKQNKGFINVYSEPGTGTIFKIYLPSHEAENTEVHEKSKNSTIFKGNETVLLVEDEEALLRFSKLQLERLGYSVLTADSPNQAISMVNEHKGNIHLLMTDVVLPEMSGPELRDKIHALRPGIKTMFMSGYTSDIIENNGIIEKGVYFLQKPFSAENLSSKIREALSDK